MSTIGNFLILPLHPQGSRWCMKLSLLVIFAMSCSSVLDISSEAISDSKQCSKTMNPNRKVFE